MTDTQFTVADVTKLAALTRLALTDEEKERFAKEIGGILAYVGQIQEVAGSADITAHRMDSANYVHKNVLRDDVADKGTGTELNPDAHTLINSAPEHTEEYVKVKKILGGSQ